MSIWAGWRRETGLEAIETCRIDIELSYDTFDDFWRWNTGAGAPFSNFLRKLPSADQDRLRNHLLAILPDAVSGRVRYGAFANAVRARVPG